MNHIGIFGGSFNPIHNGHVAVAEAALEHSRLDSIVFVPANIQPLKEAGDLAPFADRLEMARIAVEGNEKFSASDIEGNRGGVSYTIDTLRELKKEYGEDAALYFIGGGDSVKEIPKWREPAEILRIAELVVYPRGDFTANDFDCLAPFASAKRLERFRANLLEMPILPESGTEIRRRIAGGEPAEKFLHPGVLDYIRRNNLYM